MGSFFRLIAIIVFGYFAYNILKSESDPLSAPLPDPLSELQPPSTSWVFSILSSMGSFASGLVFKMIDVVLIVFSFLWSFIGFIWILLLTGLNVVYFINVYYFIKRRGSQKISAFFSAFCVLVAAPTATNWLLGQRNLALNIGLPLSLAIFVDAINVGPREIWVNCRNLVGFTLLAAFI